MTSPPSDILIVDDSPVVVQALAAALADLGRSRFALTGQDALDSIRRAAPDLVLLDAELPDMSGFAICAALKADPALADIPVIFVTAHDSPEVELAGLEAGAADFLGKPIRPALVRARARTQLRLKDATDALRRQALEDPLTGLPNRRRFDQALDEAWSRCLRDALPISLLMVDVDHFKRFNDTHGHPAGDRLLRALASAMRGIPQRPSDLLCRIGGEEFACLLPEVDRMGAAVIASRLLAVARGLPEHQGALDPVTISIGVGVLDAGSAGGSPEGAARRGRFVSRPGPEDLVAGADAALYAAKGAGRDAAWMMDVGERGGAEGAARPRRLLDDGASR